MTAPTPPEVDELDAASARAARDLAELRRALVGERRPAELGAYVSGLAARYPETPTEETPLVARAQAGDPAAREELLERFLPLVLSTARAFRADGLELADLVQEGCVGLLRALARYDRSRGVPFVAYARWWVRQGLQELRSDFLRPLRLPPKALRQLARLKSEHDRLYADERREPTLAELAERTGIDREHAAALVRADARPRSLDEPVQGVEGFVGTLGDLLEDPVSAEEYERVLDSIAGAELRSLLGRLSDREREILQARFGLAGKRKEHLAEIGERLGLSTERVRQLEERALAKLRRAV